MKSFKYPFYKIASYLLNSSYFREQLWQSSKDLFCPGGSLKINVVPLHETPYKYSDHLEPDITHKEDIAPVFITARFRSGSTFLWQLFRNVEGITSYYEPFNERRWFSHSPDDTKIDPSHIGVTDYWKEYKGLAYLDRWFQDAWSSKYLYMDERHYDPGMYNYINALIESAPGNPILQFNRMDFRLAWLRANFPTARIIHLYRNPREQWMSCQLDGGPISPDYTISPSSKFDIFYLLQWACDLRHIFPFLEPTAAGHPYAVHYYLWRLSYSFGRYYSDYSIGYEDLINDFDETFKTLLKNLEITCSDVRVLLKLNKGKISTRWKEYAPDSWFEKIEAECDRVLKVFFKSG